MIFFPLSWSMFLIHGLRLNISMILEHQITSERPGLICGKHVCLLNSLIIHEQNTNKDIKYV